MRDKEAANSRQGNSDRLRHTEGAMKRPTYEAQPMIDKKRAINQLGRRDRGKGKSEWRGQKEQLCHAKEAMNRAIYEEGAMTDAERAVEY